MTVERPDQPAVAGGARPYEVSIEVPVNWLRALGLTLDDVAAAVRQGSMELSAGRMSGGDEEFLVRTLGRNYDQGDVVATVVVHPKGKGRVVCRTRRELS